MISNYLKTTLRNLKKQRVYTTINILGLSLGITACLFIFLFVRQEISYDRFHHNARNIYRVPLKYHLGSSQFDVAMTPAPLAEAMASEFPEVEKATRIYRFNYRGNNPVVRIAGKKFREEHFFLADPNIFEVFDIPLLQGDPATALAEPNNVILTAETAEKYFGTESALGKIITVDENYSYKVSGICKKMPVNSHFHFDFMGSFKSHPKSRSTEWLDIAVYTYVVFKDGSDPSAVAAKLDGLAEKNLATLLESKLGMTYADFIKKGNCFGFELQALFDIHLRSELHNEFEPGGSMDTVVIFSIIALLILVVACINFINLATARSFMRAEEVGIRKAIGSSKTQLVIQFLTESVVVVLLAVILSVLFVEILNPVLYQLTGKELASSAMFRWELLPYLLIGIPLLGILAGIYPAFMLSGFDTVKVMKGAYRSGLKGRWFRNGLVVFQFSASIVLIIGTVIVYQQLQFVQNREIGFDKEQIVVIKNADRLGDRQQAFKNSLLENSSIKNASFSRGLPIFHLETRVFSKPDNRADTQTLICFTVDYDFQETYGMKLNQGRFFKKERADSLSVILNRAAVKTFELDQPLNKPLFLTDGDQRTVNVIGVFENFHLESLHSAVRPMAAILKADVPGELLSVRVNPNSMKSALAFIEQRWQEMTNGYPAEYVFYDDELQASYLNEQQTGKAFLLFAVLAIIIACLGLFGLAAFAAGKRTKEIGIRKVVGASVFTITSLLFKDFLKWVVIANIVAWPLAWYLMSRWLQDFAYRVTIDWWVFLLAGCLALTIALTTVSFQAVKAALRNPIEALRYE